MTKIVLASSSVYRKQLLSRLVSKFETLSPSIDETPKQNEAPEELVKRLSISKAKKVAENYDDAWIIGSDQIAVFGNKIIGKPGNAKFAFEQLSEFSGNEVKFLTGLSIINSKKQVELYELDITQVIFKSLSNLQINKYIELEKPFDCAGSFKVESKGPCLFSSVNSTDPTGLQGLPLIKLSSLFDEAGVDLLSL